MGRYWQRQLKIFLILNSSWKLSQMLRVLRIWFQQGLSSSNLWFSTQWTCFAHDWCFGFEGDFHNHYTPIKYGALQKHPIEGPVSEGFNFASSVGMVWHLCNNTKLNNQVSISLCACFTNSPNHYINLALKRVGQYLKWHGHNSYRRLIMKPDGKTYFPAQFMQNFQRLGGTNIQMIICENQVIHGVLFVWEAAKWFF